MLDDIDPEAIRTIDDILDYIAERFESEPAANYGNNLWSYRQFKEMAKSLASSMMDNFPMKKGQRVLVLLPPSYQLLLSYFALWRNGVSVIPLDVNTPLPLIDKIATSGKISGIITYDSLFSHINRNETSNIYNILTSSTEFRAVLARKNPDMSNYRNKGTRQRAVMEEMCYEQTKEGEHIDIFTDVGISDIQWKKDSSFAFLNYTFRKIISAIKFSLDIFPWRNTQALLMQKEPTSCMDVINEVIIPVIKGQRIVMVEDFTENLEKTIETKDPAEGIMLWLNMKGFNELRKFRETTLGRISIILTNFQWNKEEVGFLGKKESSLFSILGYEGISVPLMTKHFIQNGTAQSSFGDDNKEDSKVFKVPNAFVCDKYEGELDYYTIENVDKTAMSIKDMETDSIYIHRGKTIPASEMMKFMETRLRTKNCAISQDKDDWRALDAKCSKKIGLKQNLDNDLPDYMLPIKFN